jgi:hypothetical protein
MSESYEDRLLQDSIAEGVMEQGAAQEPSDVIIVSSKDIPPRPVIRLNQRAASSTLNTSREDARKGDGLFSASLPRMRPAREPVEVCDVGTQAGLPMLELLVPEDLGAPWRGDGETPALPSFGATDPGASTSAGVPRGPHLPAPVPAPTRGLWVRGRGRGRGGEPRGSSGGRGAGRAMSSSTPRATSVPRGRRGGRGHPPPEVPSFISAPQGDVSRPSVHDRLGTRVQRGRGVKRRTPFEDAPSSSRGHQTGAKRGRGKGAHRGSHLPSPPPPHSGEVMIPSSRPTPAPLPFRYARATREFLCSPHILFRCHRRVCRRSCKNSYSTSKRGA